MSTMYICMYSSSTTSPPRRLRLVTHHDYCWAAEGTGVLNIRTADVYYCNQIDVIRRQRGWAVGCALRLVCCQFKKWVCSSRHTLVPNG